MNSKQVLESLKNLGAENIESYFLINNYGYDFEYEGRKYDIRYWANCYGAALNQWILDRGVGNDLPYEDVKSLEKRILGAK